MESKVTASELVELGLDPRNPNTLLVGRKMQNKFRSSLLRKDVYQAEYYPLNMGIAGQWKWYRAMVGNSGVLNSIDWRTRGKSAYMLVAMNKVWTDRVGRGLTYAVVPNRESFIALYRYLNPGCRFLFEVILTQTPHRFYMDIEKPLYIDTAIPVDRNKTDTELQFMQRTLRFKFIPYFVEFVKEYLGIEISWRDCKLTDASKRWSKFSAHLVLTTKDNHYFQDKFDSWTTANMMSKFMELKASTDEEFGRWYFYMEAGKQKTTIDYAVHHSGTRNMRLIGAAKATIDFARHWEEVRTLRPYQDYENEDYQNFIITVNDAVERGFKKIELSDEFYKESCKYSDQVNQRRKRPAWFSGKNLRGELSKIKRGGVETATISSGVVSMGSKRSFRGGSSFQSDSLNRHMVYLKRKIIQFGHRYQNSSVISREIAECEQLVSNNLFGIAERLLSRVVNKIHPEVIYFHSNQMQQVFDSVLVNSKFFPTCSTAPKNRRLCYFGCSKGNHDVSIDVHSDLSVEYFCFGCKTKRVILQSPFDVKGTGIRQITDVVDIIPEDFKPCVIDYSVHPPDPELGDYKHYMRSIRRNPSTGKFMVANRSTSRNTKDYQTILLRGGMGTGKTTTAGQYLSDVRKDYPEAKILAISFRKMLCQKYAEDFDLELYSDELGDLYDRSIAVQLDSLERLAEKAKEGQLNINASYEVIILDEVESILHHLNSSTMKNRLNTVFQILFHLIRECCVLLCCDADMGKRTYNFARSLRSRKVIIQDGTTDMKIPNLQIHLNRHVAIETEFYDYLGEYEWLENLIESLFSGKRIFFFSNNRIHMAEIREYIRNRTEEFGDTLAKNNPNDPRIDFFRDLNSNIMIIDGQSSDTEKKRLSDCNELWQTKQMVMISPTVGAGIDFCPEKPYFHEAYGYASSNSCSARGINQMRGRVRELIDGKCHMFIKSKSGKQTDDGKIKGSEESEKTPVTFTAAMDFLLDTRASYENDFNSMFIDGNNLCVPSRVVSAPQCRTELLECQAFNLVEENLSRLDYRFELIQVLQTGNPDVAYHFVDRFNLQKNNELKLVISEIKSVVSEETRNRTASQTDLTGSSLKRLSLADKVGEVEREGVSAEDAVPVIRKNEVRRFYGLREGISSEEMDDILRISEEGDMMECISRFTRIMFLGIEELKDMAVQKGIIGKIHIRFLADQSIRGDLPPIQEAVTGQRTSQETWPSDFQLRFWLSKLLYATGFSKIEHPSDIRPEIFLDFQGHDAVSAKRLEEDDDLQEWIKKTSPRIAHSLKIKQTSIAFPVTAERWTHTIATGSLKVFLQTVFGLELSKTEVSKNDDIEGPPKKKKRVLRYCYDPEHRCASKKRCQMSFLNDNMLDLHLELGKAFLESQMAYDNTNVWLSRMHERVLQAYQLRDVHTDFRRFIQPRKPIEEQEEQSQISYDASQESESKPRVLMSDVETMTQKSIKRNHQRCKSLHRDGDQHHKILLKQWAEMKKNFEKPNIYEMSVIEYLTTIEDTQTKKQIDLQIKQL